MGSQLSPIEHIKETLIMRKPFPKWPGGFPTPYRPEAWSWGLVGPEPTNTSPTFAPLLCRAKATVRLKGKPALIPSWKIQLAGGAEWLRQ